MQTTTRRTRRITLAGRYVAQAAAALTVLFLARDTARAGVIVDQSSGATGQFIQSQDFLNLPDSSAVAFDDFLLAAAYRITAFTALGREYYGGPSYNLAVLGGIYASPDLTSIPILSASGTQVGNNLIFDFGGVVLPAGQYWVGAYVVRSNSFGSWVWNLRLPIGGSQAMWHNPGGARGYGTSPVSMGSILEQADLTFILSGDAVPPPSPTATIAAPPSLTPTATVAPIATATPIASTPMPSTPTATRTRTSTRIRTSTRTRTPTPAGGGNQGGGNQQGSGQGPRTTSAVWTVEPRNNGQPSQQEGPMRVPGIRGSRVLLPVLVALFSAGAAFAFTDADRDKMDDDWEVAHGLDPTVKDSKQDPDNDRLKNRKEFVGGTDPQTEDTDHDGSDDRDERRFRTVATDPDTDDDGIQDGDEDTDGDGTFDEDEDDAKEKCVNNDDDTDQDGLSDEDENDLGADPQDPDSDDDGIEDGNDDANEDGVDDEDEDDDADHNNVDDQDVCEDGGEDVDDGDIALSIGRTSAAVTAFFDVAGRQAGIATGEDEANGDNNQAGTNEPDGDNNQAGTERARR